MVHHRLVATSSTLLTILIHFSILSQSSFTHVTHASDSMTSSTKKAPYALCPLN